MGRYLQESYDKALREIERLREERDALAAHVEQCRQVSKRIQGYSLPEAKRCLSMALDAIDKLPELTSARRDARIKAEALEEAANYFQYGEGRKSVNVPASLRSLSIRYHRQAEEDHQ